MKNHYLGRTFYNNTNSDVNKDPRPLSPHIQIYRWTIFSFTSIMHRITGLVLYVSVIIMSWALIYYAYFYSPVFFLDKDCDCMLMHSIKILLRSVVLVSAWGFTLSLYYHLLNGIRHLFFDVGYGFKLRTAEYSGAFVIFSSILLTVATWICITYLVI